MPKEKDPKSEEVVPQTWEGKALAQLPELLQEASAARTSSIKLSSLDYAQDLSKHLLEHASTMEGLYRSLSEAVKDKVSDRVLREKCGEAAQLIAEGQKAQAGVGCAELARHVKTTASAPLQNLDTRRASACACGFGALTLKRL